MGEKSWDQLLVKEEGDLPPYLRCSKEEMSLLMTLFLMRGSKEMIVWTSVSLVDWAWSWLQALGWLQLIAPMQLLVVVVPSLIEVAIVEAWMFLLKAIEVGSLMMKISFFEEEWDERQRCPTGRARICGRINSSVRNKSNKWNSFTNANLYWWLCGTILCDYKRVILWFDLLKRLVDWIYSNVILIRTPNILQFARRTDRRSLE